MKITIILVALMALVPRGQIRATNSDEEAWRKASKMEEKMAESNETKESVFKPPSGRVRTDGTYAPERFTHKIHAKKTKRSHNMPWIPGRMRETLKRAAARNYPSYWDVIKQLPKSDLANHEEDVIAYILGERDEGKRKRRYAALYSSVINARMSEDPHRTTIVYNCNKNAIEKKIDLEKCFIDSNCTFGTAEYKTVLMNELMKTGITTDMALLFKHRVGMKIIKQDSEIFSILCPKQAAAVPKKRNCYTNGASEVTLNNKTVIVDRNKFVVPFGNQITCPNASQSARLMTTIKRESARQTAVDFLSGFMYLNERFKVIKHLFNKIAIQSIINGELAVLHNVSEHSFIFKVFLFIRKSWPILILAYTLFSGVAGITLFFLSLYQRFSVLQAIAFLLPTAFKSIKDYRNLLAQKQLTETSSVVKNYRLSVNKNPNITYADIYVSHIKALYESVLALETKNEHLEKEIASIRRDFAIPTSVSQDTVFNSPHTGKLETIF